MHSSSFSRSHPWITAGILVVVLGQALWSAGMLAAAETRSHPYPPDPLPYLVSGAAVTLLGLLLLLVGARRLAVNVDLAAFAAARALAQQERVRARRVPSDGTAARTAAPARRGA